MWKMASTICKFTSLKTQTCLPRKIALFETLGHASKPDAKLLSTPPQITHAKWRMFLVVRRCVTRVRGYMCQAAIQASLRHLPFWMFLVTLNISCARHWVFFHINQTFVVLHQGQPKCWEGQPKESGKVERSGFQPLILKSLDEPCVDLCFKISGKMSNLIVNLFCSQNFGHQIPSFPPIFVGHTCGGYRHRFHWTCQWPTKEKVEAGR